MPCPPAGDPSNPGINPGLPHRKQILYHLSHQGSFGIMILFKKSDSEHEVTFPEVNKSVPCAQSQSCLTLWTLWTITHPAPLSIDSPGKNTGVGCHFLLQGIFLTQGWNPSLLHSPALAGGFFTTVPPEKPVNAEGYLKSVGRKGNCSSLMHKTNLSLPLLFLNKLRDPHLT